MYFKLRFLLPCLNTFSVEISSSSKYSTEGDTLTSKNLSLRSASSAKMHTCPCDKSSVFTVNVRMQFLWTINLRGYLHSLSWKLTKSALAGNQFHAWLGHISSTDLKVNTWRHYFLLEEISSLTFRFLLDKYFHYRWHLPATPVLHKATFSRKNEDYIMNVVYGNSLHWYLIPVRKGQQFRKQIQYRNSKVNSFVELRQNSVPVLKALEWCFH